MRPFGLVCLLQLFGLLPRLYAFASFNSRGQFRSSFLRNLGSGGRVAFHRCRMISDNNGGDDDSSENDLSRSSSDGDDDIVPFFQSQDKDGSGNSLSTNILLNPRIQNIELNDELKSSFMSYAMSTILGRALPDARDGLKPVHRRVLYAMQCLNLTPDNTYRKCARVVGEVLGKFHPHGDMSVYDALVRMAQDFVMLHPLVAGHGNFGSVDNDPAAAMRYTEAKLSKIAFDTLLSDIKEETVDFVANFDGNEEEPLVLPARLPMLLLNGASGIAVGMATSIPPHNLGELADAIVAIIDNPSLTDEELFKIIPAPDFPTGGKIMGSSAAKTLYQTGHGSIVMRATSHMEMITSSSKAGSRTRNAIVVTELPYMTNKATLLEKIADLVNDKKIEGIADLRDESDRDGIRVVIELKRDAIPALVQNNLFKKTALQMTFSGNMLALVDEGKQPQRITLRQGLDLFIDYRFHTLRRRTKYQLKKLNARNHIVEGMILAMNRMDDIITLLRKTKESTENVKAMLTSSKYGLSTIQADAILNMQLRRLTALEEDKLKEENVDLLRQIKLLSGVMEEDAKVFSIMRDETLELKAKHAQPRRSILWEEEGSLSDEDLLANDRSVIVMTRSGYIKRVPIEEFETQSRGTRGKAGARLSADDDSVSQFFSCNDHDVILFITDKGKAYSVKAFQVPLASRIAKGVPLPQVLPINSDEIVTSVIPVDSFNANENEHLVLLTSHGFVKKTPMKAFESISARGLIIISLEDTDSLRWARRCLPHEEVLIATRYGPSCSLYFPLNLTDIFHFLLSPQFHRDGFASRFTAADLTSTGRTSRGVRALNLREGDQMADIDILRPSLLSASATEPSYVLAVTEKGYGKRIPIDEFRTQRRGGKGVIAIKFKEKAGGGGKIARGEGKGKGEADALRCMRVCGEGDEVVLSTVRGTILRQGVDDVSVQSRAATGVRIQKISPDDSIVCVDIVPKAVSLELLAAPAAVGATQ